MEDEELQVYESLSAEEVESFAERLDILRHTLRRIIVDPMDGVAGVDLRTELEGWVKEHEEEKARTRGMTLDQLNEDTRTRFIPEIMAAVKHAQDLLAALDKKEEEELQEARKIKSAL